MAELWGVFCDKLEESGYTMKDLEYCSDDLFLTIAQELNAFSPLQISSLLSFWHRKRRAGDLGSSAAVAKSPSLPRSRPAGESSMATAVTAAKPGPTYPTSAVRQAAMRLLRRVCGGGGDGVPSVDFATREVIGVEAPLSAWHAFGESVRRQRADLSRSSAAGERQPPQDPVGLLWKFCSPATLSKIERACAAGAPLELTNEDDTDALCESGVVLYNGDLATTLGSNGATPSALARRAGKEGWALVAFDAAIGRTRIVGVDEVANLKHFSMAECLEMLQEAGYDSLSVPATGAVVLCDPTQLVPRNVVYVTTNAEDGDGDDGANGRVYGKAPNAPAPSAVSRQQPGYNTASNSRRLEYSALEDDEAMAPPVGRSQARRGDPGSRQLAVVAPVSETGDSGDVAEALTTKCEIHPRKEVEFWCPKEKRLLCSLCLYYDGYTRENCHPVEVAARQEVPRLERWVGNATTFTKEIQGVMQLFADATADIDRQEDKVARDVAQQFARVREKLDALEADMLHDIRDQSRGRRQDVEAATQDVANTVKQVGDLLQEVDGPLKRYRAGGSATGLVTCVQLLRGVQRAFGNWPSVDIASYSVVQPVDACLADTEACLSRLPKVTLAPGKIELPEAIDVNYLHADCE